MDTLKEQTVRRLKHQAHHNFTSVVDCCAACGTKRYEIVGLVTAQYRRRVCKEQRAVSS
jgi:hypothetical protein